MPDTVNAVLPIHLRKHLQGLLPPWLAVEWFETREQAFDLASRAQIGWFDMYNKADVAAAIRRASGLRWPNSIFAGDDAMPPSDLAAAACC